MTDLYVMQNCCGLIKIGRSYDPENRRRLLQISDKCTIKIVKILNECGHLEENAHIHLQKFRITGEWFEGTEISKKAISKYFSFSPEFAWPFHLDRKKAAEWVRDLEFIRDKQAAERNFYRLLQRLKNSSEGNIYWESDIWKLLHPQDNRSTGSSIENFDGLIRAVLNPKFSKKKGAINVAFDDCVPAFTRLLDDALLVWPENERPIEWKGTALECCIAGLKASRKHIFNRPITPNNKPRFGGPNRWVAPDARLRTLNG